MYQVVWDEKTGGVRLTDEVSLIDQISSPRPVFFEEMNLLKFNKYFKYPEVKEPLLWAIGKKYFYSGKEIAEVKGGDMFNEPTITITEDAKNIDLEPIDIDILLDANEEALFTLENEAIDYVENMYKTYKDEVEFCCFI